MSLFRSTCQRCHGEGRMQSIRGGWNTCLDCWGKGDHPISWVWIALILVVPVVFGILIWSNQ